MCGIAGIVGPLADAPEMRAVLGRMLDALVHRGPDAGHAIVRPGAALGARRLAIQDVAQGHQPVESEDGRHVLALNGEIYDHDAIRARLAGRGARFRSRSDTETLLHLVAERGEAAFADVDGMFAAAAWDARERTLVLARDRMGEKPLVWFEADGHLVFASEWRALRQHPAAPTVPDLDALALYLQHRFVPAPWTAVLGVHRLPPAHLLRWKDGRARVAPYAVLGAPPPASAPRDASGAAPALEVRRLLRDAVHSRLGSDVPLGVLLSGGMDSAAVAAHAVQVMPGLPTFTLRPEDPDFDEGDAAAATAKALGTTHHELRVPREMLERAFAEVFDRVDEPIGDPAVAPTLLVSRFAREHVKVVLGGEGADELFGGYPTYLGARAAGKLAYVPGWIRRFAARRLAGRGTHGGNVGTAWLLRRLLEAADLPPLERHMAWFGAFSVAEQAALWRPDARPAMLSDALLGPLREAASAASATGDPVDALLRVDLLLHLPDALLAKVDRASMLASVEARAPILARDLVAYAVTLPAREKVRGRTTKIVWRDALSDLLSPEILGRRKRGFGVPVSRAFVGPLGDRLLDRLRGGRLVRAGLEPAPFEALLAEHRALTADHGRRLYAALALLEWGDRWLGPAPRPGEPDAPRVASMQPDAPRVASAHIEARRPPE